MTKCADIGGIACAARAIPLRKKRETCWLLQRSYWRGQSESRLQVT